MVLIKSLTDLVKLTANMDHVEVRIGAEIAHENMSALRRVDAMASVRWVRLSELNLIIISI